MVISITKGIVL